MGLTMILISHNLAVVHHLADEVAVMYLGKIVERGPAEAIFARAHHPYTGVLLKAVLPRRGRGRSCQRWRWRRSSRAL